jgi:hypothetical protein
VGYHVLCNLMEPSHLEQINRSLQNFCLTCEVVRFHNQNTMICFLQDLNLSET